MEPPNPIQMKNPIRLFPSFGFFSAFLDQFSSAFYLLKELDIAILNLRLLLVLLCQLLFGVYPLAACNLNELNHLKCHTDTLPDGRYLWEMTSYEKALYYGDPMETATERQWRLRQVKEMGLSDISLTVSEQLYLMGHKLSLALPSSKLMSGSAVADDLVRQGKEAGQHLIRLKDATPQIGEVLGYTIKESKILLSGRAVSHGKFDFVISKNGQLCLGAGHHTLSGGAKSVFKFS